MSWMGENIATVDIQFAHTSIAIKQLYYNPAVHFANPVAKHGGVQIMKIINELHFKIVK